MSMQHGHLTQCYGPGQSITSKKKGNNKRTDRYTEGKKKKKKVKKKIERTNIEIMRNGTWLLVGVNEYVMGKL